MPDAMPRERKQTDGCWAWRLIIAVPLTVWAVLMLVALTTPVPDDLGWDELSNAHFHYAVRHSYPGSWDRGLEARRCWQFDQAEFRKWEKRFGDNPHYWMLGYRFVVSGYTKYISPDLGVELHANDRYLEEARRRGNADGPVLFQLLNEFDQAAQFDAARELGVSVVYHKPEDSAEEAAVWALVQEKHGATRDQLVAELLAVAGDEALVYYYLAVYALRGGDPDRALELLDQGNHAPEVSSLIGFSTAQHSDQLRAGYPFQDEIISGSLADYFGWLRFNACREYRWLAKELASHAVARSDAAGLNTLHRFACRFGLRTQTTALGARPGGGMIYDSANAVLDGWPGLTGNQRIVLSELKNKSTSISKMCVNSSAAVKNPANFKLPAVTPWEEQLEYYLSGKRRALLDYCVDVHHFAVREQQDLAGGIADAFRELAAFDYTTLSWPAE